MQKKNYTTALKFNQSDQSKTNIFQCSVKYSNFRQVTRNFSGHFNKHPPTTRERGLAGKNFWFFQPKTSKNFILN